MRDPDPDYATHIPVLEQVVEDIQPRVVVEYGGGDYSTPFFLSLPYLDQLITVEDDRWWREHLMDSHADSRLWVVSSLKGAGNADLVLIDNGTNASQRIETINEVLSRPHPTVVIHDAEEWPYIQAIRNSGRTYRVDTALNPHTAIVNSCES